MYLQSMNLSTSFVNGILGSKLATVISLDIHEMKLLVKVVVSYPDQKLYSLIQSSKSYNAVVYIYDCVNIIAFVTHYNYLILNVCKGKKHY